MKIAVIGANGQLGSDISRLFRKQGDDVINLNHDRFEVSEFESVEAIIADIGPDVVVNTAAMHNVEACEDNPRQAFEVNGMGALNLALASNTVGYTLIHISTDYVFDGCKKAPYVESDKPNPLNAYGNTKLSGEFFIRNVAEKHFVLRVSGLYGLNPCRAKGGLNFVTLMLKLAEEREEVRVVDDEVLTPTYTEDIARQILALVDTDAYGLYHVTAQGSCSWHGFAKSIFELTDASVKLSVANPDEFPSKVSRPKYSVLENRALQSAGVDMMPHWREGLEKYLIKIQRIEK